jgi:3-deoxy-D-manno-octulosonic-acid transferase
MPTMQTLYSLVQALLLLLLLPLAPLLLLHPRVRAGLGERLGILPRALREQAWLSEGSLWVHAASLGEVNAVAPVVRELLPKLPRLALVLTCTTVAGREQARRLFPQAAACLLLPLDLGLLLAPWVRRLKPRLAVIAETELWPNFLRQLKRHGARVLVVNGRLTERSAKRYRWLGGAFAEVLELVDLFAMQAEEDAARLRGLGARPARVLVTGNTKFDLAGDLAPAVAGAGALRKSLGWGPMVEPVIAGSTRPGEEALLLTAFRSLRRARPNVRLVLAPRHPERTEEVAALLKTERVKFVRRSQGASAADADALLLDTLGELKDFYALAMPNGVAWVGGSFKDFGGQNPLEPAALGVPVIFGPSMRHFPEISQALLECAGARQLPAEELASASSEVLGQAKLRQAMVQAAQACVQQRSGASRRSAELGLKLLLVEQLQRDGQSWREQGFDPLRATAEFGSALQEQDWRQQEPVRPIPDREFGHSLGKGADEPLG